MAGKERDFSKLTLDLAEQTQKAVGRSRLGGLFVRAFTGSSSEAYVQLDWQSRKVHSLLKNTVHVEGNPEASRLARKWDTAMVMAASEEELHELAREAGTQADAQHAIAYISDGVVHIGTRPDRDEELLRPLEFGSRGVAMRLGRSSLEATCGIWVPAERAFVSVGNLLVVEHGLPVEELPTRFPDVVLT